VKELVVIPGHDPVSMNSGAWIADQVRNDKPDVRNDKPDVRNDKPDVRNDKPDVCNDKLLSCFGVALLPWQ
jgi:hypothetical protein